MHINLSEILLILIVALLVIKPQQLPQAARTLGRWLHWMRRTSTKIRQEMEKPLDLFSYDDEQRRLKESQKKSDEVHL